MCDLILSATISLGNIWCILLRVEIFMKFFIRENLPEMLEDVPLGIRSRMLFPYDGASAHFHRNTRQYLNNTFSNRWIGLNGPVAWPARSLDMTPLNFFLDLWLHDVINIRNADGVRDGSCCENSSRCREDCGRSTSVWTYLAIHSEEVPDLHWRCGRTFRAVTVKFGK